MTGKEIWDNYKQETAREQTTMPQPEQFVTAAKAGRAIASRLAPELEQDTDRLVGNGRMFHSGGVLGGNRASECCSHTFTEDFWVPEIEKALTIYLYWKLFPDRFRTRPDYHVASLADPMGLLDGRRPYFFNPFGR